MGELIGSVRVTPQQVAPGQPVLVQVLDPAGGPYGIDSNVTVTLDGIPVPSRYYQFPTTGTRTIAVGASGNGKQETSTATVVVSGSPLAYHRTVPAAGEPAAPGQIPFIVLAQDLANPYQATFSLATPPAAAAAAARALAAADKARTGTPVPAPATPAPTPAPTPPPGFAALRALFPATPAGVPNPPGVHLIPPEPVSVPAPATSYVWTFGDGQTATTDTPTVVHDYFPAITPGRVPFAFDVECQIVHDKMAVTRTLVLYSAYEMCRRSGVTVPNVTGDAFATLTSDRASLSASLLVYNIEATAMTVSQMAVVPVTDDATAVLPAFAFKQMAQATTIAPHSSSVLAVAVPRSQLSASARGATVSGFIVAFQGTLASAAGVSSPVRFTRHVVVRLQDQQLPPPPPAPPATAAVTHPVPVVSIPVATPAPTAVQAAQIRRSALSTVNSTSIDGGQR